MLLGDRCCSVSVYMYPVVTSHYSSPPRGRKRYVSEGDGGAIKAPED